VEEPLAVEEIVVQVICGPAEELMFGGVVADVIVTVETLVQPLLGLVTVSV
jgi:hypothetical protein